MRPQPTVAFGVTVIAELALEGERPLSHLSSRLPPLSPTGTTEQTPEETDFKNPTLQTRVHRRVDLELGDTNYII